MAKPEDTSRQAHGSAAAIAWRQALSSEFWNRDNWRVSPRGNPNIQIAGRPVTVFRRNGGWRWSIGRSAVSGPLYAARSFATAKEASANAFEALLVLVDAPLAYDIGDLECVIAHRAPEIDPADIVDAYAIPTEPDPGAAEAWAEAMENILDAVEALGERLDRLERTINGGQDDDDDERGVRGDVAATDR